MRDTKIILLRGFDDKKIASVNSWGIYAIWVYHNNTASIVQTGLTQTANFVVKEKTGKTINGHAWSVVEKKLINPTVRQVILKQAYFPIDTHLEIAP